MTLGEKIKVRRKRLKLTLNQLAGDDISYSLISQIENNKANPSMDTLNMIAAKLQLPVSDLLSEKQSFDGKELLKTVENLWTTDYERNIEVDKKIQQNIAAFLPHLSFHTYEEVRLIELYCMSTYYVTKDWPNELFEQVVQFYKQFRHVRRALQASLFFIQMELQQKPYEQVLRAVETVATYAQEHKHLIDATQLIDVYYMKAVIESGAGYYEKAAMSLEECLTISSQHSMYSKHARILQHLCFVTYQLQQHDGIERLLKQFKAYVSFTENYFEKGLYEYVHFFMQNRLQHTGELSSVINQFIKDGSSKDGYTISPIFKQELAFAYYKEKCFKQVVETMQDYQLPPYITHPLDVANFYSIQALLASSYNEIGERKKAVELMIDVKQKMNDLPHSTFKQLVEAHYEQLLY